MVNQERLVKEFMELVAIDSESGDERAIAEILKGKLTALGFEVYEDNTGDVIGTGTGNLIATIPGTKADAPTAFFSAHMDTVKPGNGIQPILKDGIITAAGDTILGSDDKAGIAAILEAFKTIRENKMAHGELQVIFSVGEEVGLLGVKNLDYTKVKAQMGYVFDCDGPIGTIISKAPSHNKIKAVIHGKAAHAGMAPEEGINAIVVASEAIAQMTLGRVDEETTANIGIIYGGEANNIVPAEVTVEGESRSLDEAKLARVTDDICRAFRETAQKRGATVDVQVELEYPKISIDQKAEVIQIAIRAAAKLGIKHQIKQSGGGSDANFYNGKGIPTANLSIGMSKVHTTDEFIKVEDLVQGAQYIVAIVESI